MGKGGKIEQLTIPNHNRPRKFLIHVPELLEIFFEMLDVDFHDFFPAFNPGFGEISEFGDHGFDFRQGF